MEDIKSPWEDAMKANYAAASANPYAKQWGSAVDQAMALGGRDYEGALRGFAQEDVNKQIQRADSQLGALGMRELGLQTDVQEDRAKMSTDASTRAMISSQGIKTSALQTMQSMLSSASGADLARIAAMIQAATAGSASYNQFQQLAIPMQQRMDDLRKQEEERRRRLAGATL